MRAQLDERAAVGRRGDHFGTVDSRKALDGRIVGDPRLFRHDRKRRVGDAARSFLLWVAFLAGVFAWCYWITGKAVAP